MVDGRDMIFSGRPKPPPPRRRCVCPGERRKPAEPGEAGKKERGGWIEEEKRGAANGEGRYPWQQPAAAQMDGVSFFFLLFPPRKKIK
jgi:hypothetical protein